MLNFSASDFGEITKEDLNIPGETEELSLQRSNQSETVKASDEVFKDIFGPDWGR